MSNADDQGAGASLRAMNALFLCECALSCWAVLSLFVFTRRHGDFFAFQVEPAMTAAFLGANFAGGLAMKLAAMSQRRWVLARQALPGAIVYEAAVGVITAQHLEQFNLGHPPAIVWIAAYVTLPFAAVLVLFQNQRRPRPAEKAGLRLATWVRACLGVTAILLLGAAAALLSAPAAAEAIWPWSLVPEGGPYAGTEGMSGYLAAWLLGIGVTLAHAAWENDARRSRCVFVGGVTLCLFNLVGVLRFASEVRWASPGAWILATLLVTLLAASVAGIRAARHAPAA